MMSNEKRIVVGYKGVIGSAIAEIFDMNYGVELDKFNVPENKSGFYIVHICLPFSERFVDVVVDYINKFDADLVLIHTSCKPGSTRLIYEQTHIPVVHCPINGRHPVIKPDIFRYGIFVGALDEEHGQMACDYIERYNIDTYLCESPEITEIAKLASTELLRKVINFYQEYKQRVKSEDLNWAEFVAFFDNIHHKAGKGKWLDRVFQRAGSIDTSLSGKHCISRNEKVISEGEVD